MRIEQPQIPASSVVRVESEANPGNGAENSFAEVFDAFSRDWAEGQQQRVELLQSVPKQFQSYLGVQASFQALGLKSQLIAKVGESASNTVRRLQQLGGA